MKKTKREKKNITNPEIEKLKNIGFTPKEARQINAILGKGYDPKSKEGTLYSANLNLARKAPYIGELKRLPISWKRTNAVNQYRFVELNLSVYSFLSFEKERMIRLSGYCEHDGNGGGFSHQEEILTIKNFLERLKKDGIEFSFPILNLRKNPSPKPSS